MNQEQPPVSPSGPPPKVVVPEVLPPEDGQGSPPPKGPSRQPSKRRLAIALAVAAISDAISFGTSFVEPFQLPLDLVTAVILFIVLGWRWPLLLGLVMEAIPGVSMFPAWVMVVAAIGALGSPRPEIR